ncbi:arylsulfatase A-like enzyme [Bradyrhizobium sp. i1.3.1]
MAFSVRPMYGEPGGLDGAITLPSILKKLGYVTRGAGKWHMGENRGSLPQNVGYDDYLGFLSVSDEYTEWRDQYFEPEIALSPSRFKMMEEAPFSHYEVHCTPTNTEQCENLKLIDLAYIKDLDKRWMDYSVDFIKQMKDSKQPFFLYHATRGCHFDNYPSDEWAGKSRARTVYSDCLVHMDYVLAQLVKALEDTGQLENTLILLTSDNGPECEIPPHGRTLFRGCKGSSWEGGVRVPTFAYWKGMIKPRRSEGLFDQADILPTFVSLAGKPGAQLAEFFPKTTYVDGVDQSGLLLADNGESARRERIYTLNQYFAMIRIDEFKYIWTAEIENGFFQKGDLGRVQWSDRCRHRRRGHGEPLHQSKGRRVNRATPSSDGRTIGGRGGLVHQGPRQVSAAVQDWCPQQQSADLQSASKGKGRD